MDRRSFLHAGAVLGAASVVGGSREPGRAGPEGPGARSPAPRQEPPDLVLRGAVVFDGTGAPGREADVAVTGERITAVGSVPEQGATEIDLTGLALAPGFIDIHSHADTSLFIEPGAESRIRQGVTLEVVGQDGSSIGPWSREQARAHSERFSRSYGVEVSFRELGGFFDAVDRFRPAVNVASMIGHGTIRAFVVGGADRPATPAEVERMAAEVRKGLAAGAVGLSSGLEYTPGAFADADELVALARELAGTGYPYASHMRNEEDQLLAAVEETLHVGRLAGVPVQVSHLKAQGRRNWWKADAVLAVLEEARAGGIDVHFDRYPYVAYATGLSSLFPSWARAGGNEAFVARLRDPEVAPRLEAYARAKVDRLGSWNSVQITSTGSREIAWARGGRLGDLARGRGVDPYDLAVELLAAEEGSVGMIGFGMSEENTTRLLAHPLGMICSDGGAYAPYGPLSGGSPHPRAYGSFPRLLGHYVRDRGAMPLEVAVHKITGMPAAKLGMGDRGRIALGAFADLVAFDPETVADGATFTDPHRYPVGIPLVVVNGVLTLRDGGHTGRRGGRAVRGMGAGVADPARGSESGRPGG